MCLVSVNGLCEGTNLPIKCLAFLITVMLSIPGKTFSRRHFKIFEMLCKLSLKKSVCMKLQGLLLGKNKKNIIICRLWTCPEGGKKRIPLYEKKVFALSFKSRPLSAVSFCAGKPTFGHTSCLWLLMEWTFLQTCLLTLSPIPLKKQFGHPLWNEPVLRVPLLAL